MGQQPLSAPGISGQIEILTAALSAAFERKVVTKEEYDRRRHEAEFSNAETLDLGCFEKLCYEPAKGQFGDEFGENGEPICVNLKTLSGLSHKLSVGEKSYVEELKFLFEEQQGIPIDHSRLILTFNGKTLQDGFRISDYKIADGSEITLMPYLKASAGCVLVLDPALLSPNLNYDFTNKFDDGTRYERGGYTYSRPYGWYRYALNVGGRYEDDVWLGEPGNRAGSTSGEWPVSYHGTHKKNADSIAMRGYDLSRSKRKLFGRGIYTSPSIEVAALYSEKFGHQSKMYMMVFQNRVNPDGLKIIDKDEINRSDVTDEYWLQPKDYYVRPYGICIKEC